MTVRNLRLNEGSGGLCSSITDFQPQIALFTFLGTVDSSADPEGAFGRSVHAAALPATKWFEC
jgi:hypothetical protein